MVLGISIVFFIIMGIFLFSVDYSDLKSRDNIHLYIMAAGLVIGYAIILISGVLKSKGGVSIVLAKIVVILMPIFLLVDVISLIFFRDIVDNVYFLYLRIGGALVCFFVLLQWLISINSRYKLSE